MEDLLLLLVLCAISKAAMITYRISEYKKYKARVLAKRKSSVNVNQKLGHLLVRN